MSQKTKREGKCRECRFITSEYLTAPNPFDPEETITGCPKCKSVDSFVMVCDEEGCEREASCGTPTQDGYRNTCGDHMRELDKKQT